MQQEAAQHASRAANKAKKKATSTASSEGADGAQSLHLCARDQWLSCSVCVRDQRFFASLLLCGCEIHAVFFLFLFCGQAVSAIVGARSMFLWGGVGKGLSLIHI